MNSRVTAYFRKGKWRVYRVQKTLLNQHRYQLMICGSEAEANRSAMIIGLCDDRINNRGNMRVYVDPR